MKYLGSTNEYFEVVDITQHNCYLLKEIEDEQLSLLWFTSDDNRLVIDAIEYSFDNNQILCLTEFHRVQPQQIQSLKLLRFNRPFYCIANHDSEVSCKGILYFGSSNLPIIHLSPQDADILDTVWKMLCIEMESRDNLQLEMLQMMLKRILILCTRIYKSQNNYAKIEPHKIDLIKAFNFLVEQHFKEKHTVAEYATLLNKSPKTLANLFKKISNKTPLELIQNRKMLEARRLLSYTKQPISEIGYQIGFNDIQSFSRFFKKKQGLSPSDFRENQP
ncbi:helix-turn-helix domain-containing protein [Aureispira anguillae]|uniref:AraC family transcriptional regulator n=1 Tax=Aureispira anguillae TaxID=2864201 RepID=A0A916DQZ2_9BACT|nr:AraC family transcriptional regulator [Aureispira anguillae]BDS09911.1 AraC family transcriptional regulator [Aureispira anguillae]